MASPENTCNLCTAEGSCQDYCKTVDRDAVIMYDDEKGSSHLTDEGYQLLLLKSRNATS